MTCSKVEDVNDELEVLVYKAKSEHMIGKIKLPLHRVSQPLQLMFIHIPQKEDRSLSGHTVYLSLK